MQHDLIDPLRRIDCITLTPIIADRIRENASGAVETRRADRPAHLRISLEPMLRILIPEMERAVATGGAEGAVLRVERDGVDGVDVADVAGVRWWLAVAFEAEVRAVVFFLDILDGAAAFNAANSEAGRVSEAGDYARLPF